jgi:hypothetical protein
VLVGTELGPALETRICRRSHRTYDGVVVEISQLLKSCDKLVHARSECWDCATCAAVWAEKHPINVLGEGAISGCDYPDFLKLVPTQRFACSVSALMRDALVGEVDAVGAGLGTAAEEIEESH